MQVKLLKATFMQQLALRRKGRSASLRKRRAWHRN